MPDVFEGLNNFRADLEASGLLRDPAYSATTVGGIIDLDERGVLVSITTLQPKQNYREDVPYIPARTSVPIASFLTGRPEYWFGRHRSLQAALHKAVLEGVSAPSAKAVMRFLESDHVDEIPKVNSNWVLRIAGEFAHHKREMRQAWEAHFERPFEKNPRIRIWPTEAFIRIGTSTNADSASHYEDNDDFLRWMNPGGAAEALNWLLDRKSTIRNQHNAIVAWMAGDPLSDPTPVVLPFHQPAEDAEQVSPFGDLHVLMMTARPPANMTFRYYWSGEATEAFARLKLFDEQLRAAAPDYFGDKPVLWHEAFRTHPRWADMVMTILQAVLNGWPLPDGVMYEIVRLFKNHRVQNEVCSFALLQVWEKGKEIAEVAR